MKSKIAVLLVLLISMACLSCESDLKKGRSKQTGVTAIDFKELAKRKLYLNVASGRPYEFGNRYQQDFMGLRYGPDIYIGVFSSPKRAKQAYHSARFGPSVSPYEIEVSIGDESTYWNRRSLFFIRDNVFVYIRRHLPSIYNIISWGRIIDRQIVKGGPGVTRGLFEEKVEILDVYKPSGRYSQNKPFLKQDCDGRYIASSEILFNLNPEVRGATSRRRLRVITEQCVVSDPWFLEPVKLTNRCGDEPIKSSEEGRKDKIESMPIEEALTILRKKDSHLIEIRKALDVIKENPTKEAVPMLLDLVQREYVFKGNINREYESSINWKAFELVGKIADKSAIPVLKKLILIDEFDELRKRRAIRILGEIGNLDEKVFLEKLRTDPFLSDDMEGRLDRSIKDAALNWYRDNIFEYIAVIDDPDASNEDLLEALRVLHIVKASEATAAVINCLEDGRCDRYRLVKQSAIFFLKNMCDERAIPVLTEIMKKDSNSTRRRQAVEALGKIGSIESLPALREIITEPFDAQVIRAARYAIKKIEEKQIVAVPESEND